MHTGTLRVISSKAKKQFDGSVDDLLNTEKRITAGYYWGWGFSIQEKIKQSKQFIFDLIDKGNKVACFGAAAKGVVFLNSCGLNSDLIDFVIDDTLEKQNHYLPGTGIKVVSRDILKDEKVDYMLILAHNFTDFIVNSFNGEFKGKYLTMFPDIKMYNHV